jgi:hypothetical protein
MELMLADPLPLLPRPPLEPFPDPDGFPKGLLEFPLLPELPDELPGLLDPPIARAGRQTP